MQNPAQHSHELTMKRGTSGPGTNEALEETLCAAAEATASLDTLLKSAAQLPVPSAAEEQQWAGLLSRVQDLEFVRKQSRTLMESSSAENGPETLGPFELLERLGEGGMGAVYRARHLRLGKLMAVKVMHSHRLDDQELRSRFYREMRALGQLQHPNIVSAQHADEVDGVPYLAMEYVDGISLASLFHRLTADEQPVPISVVCELVRQAAEGIQYAHDQGVLHRDLKPGNLMLDREGRVRVLDLGLARMTESIESGESSSNDEHLTSQHQILGTPGYMAPEQLTRGHEMDSRTDVYALGATAFYLLTGKRVHSYSNSESIVQHAMRVVAEPAPDLKTLRKDVPDELAQLIANALEREPAQRLQSAGELARRLSRWSSKEALRGLWTDGQAIDDGTVNSLLDTERLPGSAMPVRQAAAEAATVIMPTAESYPPGGSEGPRRRAAWLIPAGFFAIILLAGVLLKLRTKDGGELIIQSDDPDAKISISAVQGEQSEELQLLEQDDRTLKLTQGKWAIHIEGPEASGFELSSDSIVVSPGSRQEIRVTRRKAGDTVAMSDAPQKTGELPSSTKSTAGAPKQPSGTPMEKEPAPKTSTPVVPDSSDVVMTNGDVDWTPGRLDNIGWGLVPQPANLDSVATWQMQLLRPPTGMCSGWYNERQAHLDPRRELIATCDEYGARVIRISDGHVIGYCNRSDGSSFTSIAFSPDGSLLMLSSRTEIEIRQRDGRLIRRWTPGNQFYRYHHSHLSTIWMPTGDILAWTDSGAVVYSVEAKVLHELSVYDESKTPWMHQATINPTGKEILFSGQDKSAFKWSLGDSDLEKLLSVDDATSTQAIWSPNGQQILVTPYGGENLPSLWSPDGTRLVTGKTPMYLAAWSPDGRFIVDGYRRVFSSETLELLRTLELAADHGHYNNTFTPFWPAADEIVLLSQSPNRTYASGSVFRFHPSGRRLASLESPQLLSVGSATLAEEDSVRTVHLSSLGFCSLGQWEESGRPLGVKLTNAQHSMQEDSPSWNPVNGHMLISSGSWSPVHVVDREGRTVRSIPEKGTNLAWSGDGKRLSMVNRSIEGFGIIAVYGESEVPEFESPPLAGYVYSSPSWSPDGRWLIWDVGHDPVPEEALLYFVDMHSEDKTVQSITLPAAAGTRWMAFSPDSQWIAVFNNTPPNPTACLLRMSDLKVFEKRPETTSSTWNALAGCWASDSSKVVLGDLYDVDPAAGLERVGKFYCDALRPQLLAFTADNKALWTESPYDRKFGIKDLDGQQVVELAASGYLRPGHIDPNQAKLQSEDNLVFLSIPVYPSQHTTSTGVLNLKQPGIRWTGLAYDNGQQVTLSPGGEILHGPANIDQYVIHTINYPGGITTPVTRQELIDRAIASPEQKAIFWASDLRAVIRIQDASEPWSAEPALPVSDYPAAKAIVELDFSGHLQITNAELLHLSRFNSLVKLSIAKTTLSAIPDCSQLSNLAELDLSQTQITSLTGLQNCQSLRRLELTSLQLDAASWQTLASLTGLESLNLSNTTLDSLSALDLSPLKSLKHLDVRGTKLTESDVTSLKAAFPDCEVLSGTTVPVEK